MEYNVDLLISTPNLLSKEEAGVTHYCTDERPRSIVYSRPVYITT
jgi:hypothetical protein